MKLKKSKGKNMIITISGKPGSGKSTLADSIAKILHMKRYSVGGFRRQQAKKRGMTLEEYNKLGEKEAFTDKDADEWQKEIGKKEDNFIIDGRLSYHFISHSIKIFLDVSPEVGSERIRAANREGELMKSKKEALKMWQTRYKSDIERYKKYYNLYPYDKKNYDFVLDTSNLKIEEATDKVLDFLKIQKNSKHL